MRPLPGLAAVCAALALAACGGGDDGDAADRDAFLRAADANCRQRSERNRARPSDELPGRWVDDFAAELAAQRKLGVPDDLRARWDTYLRELGTFVTESRKLYDEEARRTGESGTASAKANRAGFLARKAATDLGLATCGSQFS
ncbi:MAG TPA: hypothetical protein VN238_05620 [Solirubrobacteraceae bacterium]|nr:hypothetical protein [Solirubrobacteraceae bacterium]